MITIHRQCELLPFSRSGFYYIPVEEDPFNLKIMRRIDEQYTRTPFYGVRRMTQWLIEQGYAVNRKRVRRLMRLLIRVSLIGFGERQNLTVRIGTALYQTDQYIFKKVQSSNTWWAYSSHMTPSPGFVKS